MTDSRSEPDPTVTAGSAREAPDGIPALRDRLVGELVAAGRIRTDRVAAAFRAVPRHLFLPGVDPATAYQDVAVPTKWAADGVPISSSSQPAVMAAMLEQLDVRPGQRVLEIGSGTGYNAALLAELVGVTGAVTTVDIDEDLVERARRNLRAAGAAGVEVVRGDGAEGWPDAAPFDRVILTAAARDLAPAWSRQLAESGRLVLPLSLRGPQRSVAFERAADHLASVSIVDCGFMPLRGGLAGPVPVRPLGDEPGQFLELDDPRRVDTAALLAAVRHGGGWTRTSITVTPAEIMGGLRLWLALREPDAGQLVALDSAVARIAVPAVVVMPGVATTPVLVGDRALAALVPVGPPDAGSGPRTVGVRAYGPTGEELADRLLSHVRAWDAAGRPSSAGLRIRAYPRSAADLPASGPGTPPPSAAVDTRHTHFLLDW